MVRPMKVNTMKYKSRFESLRIRVRAQVGVERFKDNVRIARFEAFKIQRNTKGYGQVSVCTVQIEN